MEKSDVGIDSFLDSRWYRSVESKYVAGRRIFTRSCVLKLIQSLLTAGNNESSISHCTDGFAVKLCPQSLLSTSYRKGINASL
jgi:hypothetical protein